MEYEVYPRVYADPNKILDYEFSPNYGISGILMPDGEFRKCGNCQHHLLVSDIDYFEQKKCVFFSMSAMWREGVITISPNIHEFDKMKLTDAQREWMESHKEYMDKWQQDMLPHILEEY